MKENYDPVEVYRRRWMLVLTCLGKREERMKGMLVLTCLGKRDERDVVSKLFDKLLVVGANW